MGSVRLNRGEIWWYELPELGRRPGCIVTRQSALPVLNAVLVAPATRTIRGIPSELSLGVQDGMPSDCVLSFGNLITIPKSFLVEQITSLAAPRLPELCRALRIATGCD